MYRHANEYYQLIYINELSENLASNSDQHLSMNQPFDYEKRRTLLFQTVKSGQILLLGNTLLSKNFKDNTYQFRQDSTFLYYIGLNLPDLSAILDCDTGTVTVYGNDATLDDIIWIGSTESLIDRAKQLGIDRVKKLSDLSADISNTAHTLPTYTADQAIRLSKLMNKPKAEPSMTLIRAIIEQRNVKSQAEIEEMHKAASLSNEMHRAVMQATQPGMSEHQLAGVVSQVAWENNTKWAYEPILTINGQILHNHSYHNKLKEGDMLLYDGGVELANRYCGDITRTWPVSSQFTSLQKDIYNTVLAGYKLGEELSIPGTSYKSIHLSVAEKMTEDLIEIGWMKGDSKDAVAAGAHTLFFQHGLGHMIGLDVHDMENLGEVYVGYEEGQNKSTEFGLKSLRLGRTLKAGYCITIEPGIYVIPQLIDKFQSQGKFLDFINYDTVNKHRDFGGIRIEDDFVITSDGNQKLGDALVLEAAEIETIRTAANTVN